MKQCTFGNDFYLHKDYFCKQFILNINNFNFRNEEWEKLFIDALDRTSFEGVTVRIAFSKS